MGAKAAPMSLLCLLRRRRRRPIKNPVCPLSGSASVPGNQWVFIDEAISFDYVQSLGVGRAEPVDHGNP
jgi:hypothetical protein